MRGWTRVFSYVLVGFSAACGGSDDNEGTTKEKPCQAGAVECSTDALTLRTCDNGAWKSVDCMAERGQLCEAGECVDPWRYGSPSFDQCASEPRRTPESLSDKARYFEEVSRRLHIHPKLGWLSDVTLPCAGGDCTQSSVAETEATWQDVESWDSGENDGLWSSLYLGAEAYRWAVTKDPEALDTLKLLLDSEAKRMRITGVPGLFTRQMIPPDVPGIACPTDPAQYVPVEEKVSNRWVRIASDGCIETVDAATLAWKKSSACGLGEFAGWCWLDNVSQDEYAGHMFALGAVAKLVDVPEVQTVVKDLLTQIGDHLVENQLAFVDWDGRLTEHGRIFAGALVGGYGAAMSLAFIKTIALATGDPKFSAFYDDCLLQKNGEKDCIDHIGASTKPYDQILTPTGLNLGCKSNWNNFSMYMLSLHGLLWSEHEPVLRAKVQAVLRDEMWLPPGEDRPLSEQNNAFFDFIYAAGKIIGPKDGPATEAVENGICMLRQFPAHKLPTAIECPSDKCIEVCKDRFDQPMTDYPRPIAERCVARFVWWGSPYSTDPCTADARGVRSPADYLVAYWMGRYYGFIRPES